MLSENLIDSLTILSSLPEDPPAESINGKQKPQVLPQLDRADDAAASSSEVTCRRTIVEQPHPTPHYRGLAGNPPLPEVSETNPLMKRARSAADARCPKTIRSTFEMYTRPKPSHQQLWF
jgi:hypothetical protein